MADRSALIHCVMKVALDEAPRCEDIIAARKPKLGGKGRLDYVMSFLVLMFASLFVLVYFCFCFSCGLIWV